MMRIAFIFLATVVAWSLHAETRAPEKIYAQEMVNRIVEKYPDLEPVLTQSLICV